MCERCGAKDGFEVCDACSFMESCRPNAIRECCRKHWELDAKRKAYAIDCIGPVLMNPLGMPFICCVVCRNKRCPKATDCSLGCTNSNAVGQEGSIYG